MLFPVQFLFRIEATFSEPLWTGSQTAVLEKPYSIGAFVAETAGRNGTKLDDLTWRSHRTPRIALMMSVVVLF